MPKIAEKYDETSFHEKWAHVADINGQVNRYSHTHLKELAERCGWKFAADSAEELPLKLGLNLADGILDLGTGSPPQRDWVLDDIILAEKVVVLAGMGGVSKTQLALQLAVSIALGTLFMGRAVKQGRVLLLLGEEDRAEIIRRINAIIRNKQMTSEQIHRIKENTRGFGLVGQDTRLTDKFMGALSVTSYGGAIIDAANEFGDVSLIILDHVGLFHGGDFNAREDAALSMRVVNGIASKTGASVLMLAHSPKSAMGAEKSDSSQVAGSTAFVDQARGALMLAGMRDTEAKEYGITKDMQSAYVSLTVTKNNYGPTGGIHWFHRFGMDGVGLLEHIELTKPTLAVKGSGAVEVKVLEFVKAHPGQFSKTGLRDTYGGKDGQFNASKNDVAAALENLIADGQLISRPPTPEEKQKFSHGPRVLNVLEAAP